MKQHIKQRILAVALPVLSLSVPVAEAANYGTDLNLTMMPATGGMGGVGIARPVEPAAAVFGNPAALTQFNDGTSFTFGATLYDVTVNATHNGLDTGQAWSGKSRARPYLIPTIAITQPLGANDVLGIGFTAVSGVGSDFRGVGGPNLAIPGTSASLDANAELLVFGANVGWGHKFNNQLSGGVAVTIGNGYAQTPLASNTASVHSFGVRATAGLNYEVGSTTVGGYYRSPLSITYDHLTNIGPAAFNNFRIEQPQEFAIGIANTALMNGNLLLATDIIYKDWNRANFYKDFYKSQTVVALGAQLTSGPFKYRLGFSHVNSPIKSNVTNVIGGASVIGLNGVAVPLTPSLVRYFQATNAEVIWENQVTLGVGYQVMKGLQVDGHLGLALNRSEQIGNTNVNAKALQTGVGLTWKF